jgi:hypothetical protein
LIFDAVKRCWTRESQKIADYPVHPVISSVILADNVRPQASFSKEEVRYPLITAMGFRVHGDSGRHLAECDQALLQFHLFLQRLTSVRSVNEGSCRAFRPAGRSGTAVLYPSQIFPSGVGMIPSGRRRFSLKGLMDARVMSPS